MRLIFASLSNLSFFDKTFGLTFSVLQPIDVSSTVHLAVSLFPSRLSACLTV